MMFAEVAAENVWFIVTMLALFALVTLGFGEIIRILIINTDKVGGPLGLTNIPKWAGLGSIYTAVALVLIVVVNLIRSTHGRAIISIREDETAAESMGINTFRYKTLAFVVGSATAGIAGALFAHSQQFIGPSGFSFMASVTILLMIILGGLGSVTGSIVGAFIITVLPELLRFFGTHVADARNVIFAVLLILLMLWRPSGIFGKHELDLTKFLPKKGERT